MTKQKPYGEQFFNKLRANLTALQDKLTVKENGGLSKSIANTCHFAQALHKTFKEMDDIAGILAMGASCDYSPISEVKTVS